MWVGSISDAFSEHRLKGRIRFISLVFGICFGLVVFRLFFLQVIKGDDFARVSESNRTQTIFLGAPRGNFYDIHGKKLVTNRPSWSLMYSVSGKSNESREEVFSRLRPFLDPFNRKWEKRLNRAFKSRQLVRLVEDVPSQIAFGMREMGELLPGLRMELEFRRDYPEGVHAAQLLGYMSEIDERELKNNLWFARKPGDFIGKMGMERLLDSQIRGKDGGMLIEVDSIGRLKKVIKELPYKRGHSVQLTLDSDLQKVAHEAILRTKSGRGAVVAMNIETGEIPIWVSVPSFDPSGSLVEDVLDPNLPFFDRVYKGAYPPGSIYKIITAMAGLEMKAFRKSETINCIGYVILKGRRQRQRKYRCWRVHGKVNFWKALSESCDSYFYLMSQRIGSQAMYEMSRRFGLGDTVQKTLPNENKANIPNASWKRKKGLGGWSTGDSYNMSIGQGYVTSTPLQMVYMMAGFVSRGTFYRPYIINRIFNEDGVDSYRAVPHLDRTVELEESIWDSLLYATRLVVKEGTGRAAHVRHLEVRGKTGSAQNPHGEDHAWFLASAGYPGEKPILAVCVFVENGGGGGAVAAPIARQVLAAALPKREKPNTI